jgi:predicted component of type VI protein secretion system
VGKWVYHLDHQFVSIVMANEHMGTASAGPTYLIHASEHRAYPLAGKHTFTIGRDTACDIVVNEVSVSRRHAELRPDGENYALHATGSTPTMLNDTPLTGPQVLQEGDSFLIGTMKFIFTRERLPVAVVMDQPAAAQFISSIDDRRPTLTFQLPPQQRGRQKGGRSLILVILLLLVAITAYVLLQPR